MADKSISELVAASQITPTDLFVLEQNSVAKKLAGQVLENWLVSYADGHGGIQSVEKTSSSGTNPVVDTYTITLADTTTASFTVTNGVKGDTGASTYVWVKYSSQQPVRDSDMYDTPDAWMGMYVGLASTAPTSYTSYKWYKIEGEQGEPGDAASITSQEVRYQVGTSGTVAPSGTWTANVPNVPQGQYLWTRTEITFNTGDVVTSYSVGRMGVDGSGAVSSVNEQSPDASGNITITASNIATSSNVSVQSALDSKVADSAIIDIAHGGTGATAARSAAEVLGVNAVNLIDNPDFSIAQAGIGGLHGSEPYAADRWKLTSGTASDSNGHVKLNGTVIQQLSNAPSGNVSVFIATISGTASVSYSDGVISVTGNNAVIDHVEAYEGTYTADSKPAYVKPIPDVEWLKCYSDFVRYGVDTENKTIGVATARSTTVATWVVQLPKAMRESPVLASKGSAKILGSVTKSGLTPTVDSRFGDSFVRLNLSTSGLTAGQSFIVVSEANGLILDFIADRQ